MSDSSRITDLLRSSFSLSGHRRKPDGARTERTADKKVFCPECSATLREKDRSDHLIAVHGYVAVSGVSLPIAAAVTCLWDRVFNTADSESHERLRRLISEGMKNKHQRTNYAA